MQEDAPKLGVLELLILCTPGLCREGPNHRGAGHGGVCSEEPAGGEAAAGHRAVERWHQGVWPQSFTENSNEVM